MFLLMRRLLATSALTLLALCAVASPSLARTPKPTISSVTPTKVAVGGVLTLKGKNFRSGVRNNRVFFVRASDGKSVRVRPRKATKTRLDVLVPSVLTALLTDDGQGGKKETRFQLMVFTTVLGPKTKVSRSPLISPEGATVPGAPGTPPPPPPDCDSDGTPDASDADDDNDGLGDDLEAAIKTNPCAKDTDGDNVEDAFEYYSARDLNSNAVPYPGARPFPNALDGTDADTDFDGDGMTSKEEFAVWNQAAGRVLPVNPGESFPYSDGNQTSPSDNGIGFMDLDENGRITDEEKDADNDRLPNWVEMVKGEDTPTGGCAYVPSSDGSGYGAYGNMLTDCGLGPMPNGRTFGKLESGHTLTGAVAPAFSQINILSYLNPDSDGDSIPDGEDDQDFDSLSNLEEIQPGTDGFYSAPKDPCDPNPDARSCPTHASHT
jgi:hypothetical protein